MAYRLHVQVYDGDGRRLGLGALRRDLAGLLGRVGFAGTRYGAPGVWIESYRRDGIRQAAYRYARFAENTGYVFRFYATNATTAKAVADLVGVQRG